MNILFLVCMIIIYLILGYIIYSDLRAEQLKCKKIEMINFVTMTIGVLLWNVFIVATKKQPYDWFELVSSIIVNILIAWVLFGKTMYVNLKHMPKDSLPYNQKQHQEIIKTYIRNVLFLIVYVLLSVVYICISKS